MSQQMPPSAGDSAEPGSFNTLRLNDCVQRWQAGNTSAGDELCRGVAARLEVIARKMLRGYPTVRDKVDTMDVFQEAVVRLLNTLRKSSPPTTRDFFNLAANHIRCALIDLARHFRRRESLVVASDDIDQAESAGGDDLELWARLHEAVASLPTDQREVFSLVHYHDWTQAQIAELLGESERNVRRRWTAAVIELTRQLGGELPAV